MSRSGTAYERDMPYERLNEISSLTENKTPENFTHPVILINKGFGHSMQIVGWDDDYSCENFASKPDVNGAWLVKNSYSKSFADRGYCWISYAQKIGDCAVFIAGENLQGMNCKGYDVLTDSGRINYHWSANIFRADEDEKIMYVRFIPPMMIFRTRFTLTSSEKLTRKIPEFQKILRLPAAVVTRASHSLF